MKVICNHSHICNRVKCIHYMIHDNISRDNLNCYFYCTDYTNIHCVPLKDIRKLKLEKIERTS